MTFSSPLWLLAGAVACIGLVWMWRRYDARQQAALAQFVSAHLREQLTRSVSIARRRAKRALVLGALALLFVAMAGPQGGYRWEQVTRRGNDIIFAVDTSRSMLTPDVKPNRLERAKLAIDDFVTRLDGDSVGLVAFAGNAFLQSPLTLDYGAFHESLNALDTNIIPRGGTDIASAIREAQAALERRPGSDKILVLVTDGEDLEGDALAAARAAARKDGMKIFTVGVGTSNGDLIPLPADQGGGFLKDAAGNLVKSHLDESALKAIAAATGGLYAPLGAEGQGLDAIYRQALAPLAKHALASRQQRVYTQLYQWPLAVAFAMLLASLLIGNRRRNSAGTVANASKPSSTSARQGLVASGATATLGLLLFLPPQPARASTSAAMAYAKGDFAAAERDYAAAAKRSPGNPILQYNFGTAAYRAGNFSAASQAFHASLGGAQSADAKRVAEQQDAYYNLGNALYRIGQKTEKDDPQQTIQNWTQSLKDYEAALQLRANDADSRFNRDFVQRKLAELQKEQSQQSQQKKNQSSTNSKQDSQKGKQQGKPQAGQQGKQQGEQSQGKQQGQQGQGSQKAGQKSQPNGSQAQGQNQPQPGSGPSKQNDSQQQNGAQPNQGAPRPGQSPQTASTGQPTGSGAKQSMPAKAGTDAGDQRLDETARAADTQHLPGQMSREEALELLDSLKNEERRLPAAPLARNGANAISTAPPAKDW